jgi:hypothetical protein
VQQDATIQEMCLNVTYRKVNVGEQLSDTFPIQNGLKQGGALSPLLFNFALEYAIRKVQEKQMELKLNCTYRLLAYADQMDLWRDYKDTTKKGIETLTDAGKELDLEIRVEKTRYILLSRHQKLSILVMFASIEPRKFCLLVCCLRIAV